jgi:hypothetical protein
MFPVLIATLLLARSRSCTSQFCIFFQCPVTSRPSIRLRIRNGICTCIIISSVAGGRPTEISDEAALQAASSVVVEGGFARRGFFLAGIDKGAAIVCGQCRDIFGSGARYQGSVRFVAFQPTVNVRFRFGLLMGQLMAITVSVGIEVSSLVGRILHNDM